MEKNVINLKHENGEPLIRILLFEGQQWIDFVLKQPFDIYDLKGNLIEADISSKLRWRIKVKESEPGKAVYRLILWETTVKKEATKKLSEIKNIDPGAVLDEIGGEIYIDDRFIINNVKYRICSSNFETLADAKQAKVNFRPEFNPFVEKVVVRQPSGAVELFDSEYEHSAEAEGGLKIVPHLPASRTHFFEIKKYDSFMQKEYYRDLYFNGATEFRFDIDGKLSAISEIPMETYLSRAIYSESTTDLHIDFYKSLAIALRSEIFSRLDHNHRSEPYDFCDWGHCIRYYGDKFEDENILKAIEDTRGMAIKVKEGQVFDAYFNTVCGGHTESSTGIWETEQQVSCSGKFDGPEVPKGFKGLQSEEEVKKWVNSRPAAFCNLHGKDIPRTLMVTNRYFRWEVNYQRREMRELIKNKLGIDLGELIDIVPLRRSQSGRIKELELIGSLKSIKVKGELNIRSTLSEDYLESSCFIVEKELDESGFPLSFTLLGAGHGHGQGMCKSGAAVMAMENYDYKQIIKHYFDCDGIEKLY